MSFTLGMYIVSHIAAAFLGLLFGFVIRRTTAKTLYDIGFMAGGEYVAHQVNAMAQQVQQENQKDNDNNTARIQMGFDISGKGKDNGH